MAPLQKRASRHPQAEQPARSGNRELMVRCATELMTEQGFSATGIDEVLKRVGVPKGSFYYYFASKQAFGEAVIANYDAYFARKLDRILNDASLSPVDRLRAFVADAKAGMARYQFRRGCLV